MVSYLRKVWCRGSIQRQSSGPNSPPIPDRRLRPDVRFRYLLLVSLSFLLFLPLFVTCGKDSPTQPKAPEPTPPPPPTPVATRVDVSPTSATLTSVGQTVQLTARVFDQNSAPMNAAVVTWTSSATGVVTISGQGLVTAVSNGSAQITARSGNALATATVTVMQSVGSIAMEPSTATLMSLGETVQLTATVLDQNGQPVADAVVTWTSSATGVATVSGQGLVTAVSNGSATITARSGSASANITVTVMQSAGNIAIEPSSATLMALGETVQLTATVLDQNGQPVADAVVTWTSSATGVATVSSKGLVTAVNNGSAQITARSGNALATATVTVMQSVGSIAMEPSTATLMSLGETVQLTATVLDQNGQPVADAVVTWTSSAVGVATVSTQGLVTAVSNGSAQITARSGNASASINVTVSAMDDSMDRDALIALYNSTNGPNWAVSTNWASEAPLGTWYGVSTNSAGRVDSLLLDGNGLRGSIPPELGTLTNLRFLSIGANYLVGSIPPELGKLTQLERLSMGQNALTGTIPPELGELAQVRILYLVQNALSGSIPPELGNLAALKFLNLNDNQLTGSIPSEFGNLTKLVSLHLQKNQLSGSIPPELGNLTKLEQVYLMHNQLSGPIPSELGNLASLTGLYLYDNELTGPIPSEFGNLEKLQSLFLWGNQLSGPIPPELGKLGSLEFLLLDNNQLTGTVPPELGNLSNLGYLALSNNQLEGSIPQSFLGLTRLYSLGCRSTEGVCLPATDAFREWEGQVEARGNVDNPVDIPYCDEIDRHGLVALYEATNGLGWTFSNGWLDEDESLDQWYGVNTDSIGRVSSLDLNSNGLSGSVPDALGMLANMKKLKLGNNALSGRLPLSLSSVPLEEFDYAGTSLCVADDADFQGWLDGIPLHNGTGVLCDPLTEREILASLYWSTGGPQWANSSGWPTDAPLSSWYGVETDDVGRVVALRLGNNNLTGELPTELGQLVKLRTLRLDRNNLSGSIPSELGDLERLQLLYLNKNQLTGEVPTELGQLAELRVLVLSTNQLSGSIPLKLGDLERLERLHLFSNQFVGDIPAEIGKLVALRQLNLYDNNLTGSIPMEVGELTNMVSLNLASNQISGSIPTELGDLANLTDLNLGDNQLTGAIPSELGMLVALELMLLEDNKLTGPIPPELGSLSKLVDLNLSENELTGPIPTELGDLANLTDLNLGDNQLTGPIPGELGRVGSLEHLDLRSNALSGPVPPEIGNLTLLKSLILADNTNLAGRLSSSFTALGRLEMLMAGGTGLCRPADARFDAWFRAISNRRLVVCEGGAVVYLTQTVQSWDDPVPLLAGEPALLRVFVTGSQDGVAKMPDVRATFYVNGAERHTVHFPSSTLAVPTVVDEGDLELSANAEVPAWVIVPGLEMVIEVDPDGVLDPALGATMRIPDSGSMPVDVRTTPPFRLTLVPFLFESNPDRSVVENVEAMAADPHGHELLRDVRTLLPIAGFEVKAHEPVVTSSVSSRGMLAQIEAVRLMEEGSGYWMGVFERTSGQIPGVARRGGSVSVSVREASVMAHELGHNFGLEHAPCGTTHQTDPWYPYPGGRIGAWGYDFEQRALVPPRTPDIMSYCGPPFWISDFFFNKALNYRLEEAGTEFAVNTEQTLLLWGGRDEDGVPHLDPAFVVDAVPSQPHVGGAYIIEGITADDEILFSFSFDMPVNPDALGEETSFVFTLPVEYGWAGNLESITLSGPGGTAVLDKSTNLPMAILQDPVTRQVRAFLSDLPAGGSDREVAARATVVDPGLEMIFSRGIPDLR